MSSPCCRRYVLRVTTAAAGLPSRRLLTPSVRRHPPPPSSPLSPICSHHLPRSPLVLALVVCVIIGCTVPYLPAVVAHPPPHGAGAVRRVILDPLPAPTITRRCFAGTRSMSVPHPPRPPRGHHLRLSAAATGFFAGSRAAPPRGPPPSLHPYTAWTRGSRVAGRAPARPRALAARPPPVSPPATSQNPRLAGVADWSLAAGFCIARWGQRPTVCTTAGRACPPDARPAHARGELPPALPHALCRRSASGS